MIFSLKKQKRKIKQCNCSYEAVEDFSSLSTFVYFQAQAVPQCCIFKYLVRRIRVFVHQLYSQPNINNFEGFLQQKCIKTIIKACNVLQAYTLMMCSCGANGDFRTETGNGLYFTPKLEPDYGGACLVGLKTRKSTRLQQIGIFFKRKYFNLLLVR